MNLTRDQYDTLEGIQEQIKTVDGTLNLFETRNIAGYDRKEHLQEFVVFGYWYMDTCGNCMYACKGFIPCKSIPFIPSALTIKQFWDAMRKYDISIDPNTVSPEEYDSKDFDYTNDKRRRPTSVSWSMGVRHPIHGKTCPVCKKGWTVENIGDIYTKDDCKLITSKDFPGQTIEQILATLNMDKHYQYDCHWQQAVQRNKEWINAFPSTILMPEDKFMVYWRVAYHNDCFQKEKNQDDKNALEKVITKAGLTIKEMKAVPNQYCSCEICAPWQEVITEQGLSFLIGWRKRVINIEVHDPKFNVGKLNDDDVTKGSDYIHAWGYDKATEYLKKMLQETVNDKSR